MNWTHDFEIVNVMFYQVKLNTWQRTENLQDHKRLWTYSECLIQNYHIHQALIRRAAKLSDNALRNTRGLLIETQTQKELYWLKSPPITCCCFCRCSVCNVDPMWMSMSVSLCVFDFFVFLRLRFFAFIEAVIEGYNVWMHDCEHVTLY